MNLSDTDEARAWLAQFEPSDQPFARLLLEGLVLVSRQDFERDLQTLILLEAKRALAPVVLVPIRETKHLESYYEPDTGEHRRNAKARLLSPDSLPGSEAIVAQIMTTLTRINSNLFVKAPADLSSIRKARCRSIFFVDDLIGSGNRVNEFFDVFNKHPTIKSWYSFRWIRFYVITYSVTEFGKQQVLEREDRPPEKISYIRKCPTFDEMPWTPQQRKAIEDICIRYNPGKNSSFALGFKESKGMMIFEHSVPNNAPAILWKSGYDWKPLFPKAVLPSLAHLFRLPPIDLEQKLNELGQPRLARGAWHLLANPYLRKVVLVP